MSGYCVIALNSVVSYANTLSKKCLLTDFQFLE